MISRYLGGAVGLLFAASSLGQTIGAGFLSSNRPSDLSPSTRVGRIAGGGTGPSSPTARGGAGYSGPAGSNLPAFRGFGTGVDPDYGGFNRAFRPSMNRRWFPRTNPGSLINPREGSATMRDIYNISALGVATSMDVPVMGWEPPSLPLERGRVYIPPSDASPFHQFFRLIPTHEVEVPLVEVHQTPADRMGVIQQGYIDDLMRKAKAAFKDGTTPGLEGREESLARAMNLCDVVRQIDPTAWEPTLLHLHAAVLKRRPERAMYDLRDLAIRNPDFFKTRHEFGVYYGDSKAYMETAFQEYIRQVEVAEPEASKSLLQGYCAWALEDTARLRLALGRADDLNRADKNDAGIDRTRRAMLAGLATETAAVETPTP